MLAVQEVGTLINASQVSQSEKDALHELGGKLLLARGKLLSKFGHRMAESVDDLVKTMDSARNVKASFEAASPALALDFGLKQLAKRAILCRGLHSFQLHRLGPHLSLGGHASSHRVSQGFQCREPRSVWGLGGAQRGREHLAVGARLEDSNAQGIGGDQNNNDAEGSGAVYVFVRQDSHWSQQAYVKASNTDAGDNFGSRAALSADGNTLAVEARGEQSNAQGIGGDQTGNDAEGSGAVYLY